MPNYVEAGHLGGYIPGGDEATFYPDLWAWLVREKGVKSVLDVGCGDGQALKVFEELGCRVVGLEGVPQTNPKIRLHDFTKGPYVFPTLRDAGASTRFDLVWSCEFVEHVEEQYMHNFLEAFKHAPMVLLTHADVGQPGYHHVNCQPIQYWMAVMAAIGYRLDRKLTEEARAQAMKNQSPWNHFLRSGAAFVRY